MILYIIVFNSISVLEVLWDFFRCFIHCELHHRVRVNKDRRIAMAWMVGNGWHICDSSSSDVHIDGLVQERRNSSAWAMESRLSCTNPSIYIELQLDILQNIQFGSTWWALVQLPLITPLIAVHLRPLTGWLDRLPLMVTYTGTLPHCGLIITSFFI